MCWYWEDDSYQLPATSYQQSPRVGLHVVVVLMDTWDTIAVAVGSVLLIGSLVAVVVRELWSHPERRLVGRARDTVEVLLPLVGAIVLVAAVWITAA